MTPEPQSPAPESRSSRLRILLPVALVTAGLALFLALFWRAGHGGKGHGHRTAAERNRSPVGGSGDEGNTQVTGGGTGGSGSGGSPVGGGPSRSGSGSKGETWWYHGGKARSGAPEDSWWSPKKSGSKAGSRRESPVGGSATDEPRSEATASGDASEEPAESKPARERDKPAHASSGNPGEVAGQKGGPDDFWWRN
jgi:hypothetical protein